MSYTKIRRIQQANILLEGRYLIREVEQRRDSENNLWYTSEVPNKKTWKIYLKKFQGGTVVDPATDKTLSKFANFFVEYDNQALADASIDKLMTSLKTGNVGNTPQNTNQSGTSGVTTQGSTSGVSSLSGTSGVTSQGGTSGVSSSSGTTSSNTTSSVTSGGGLNWDYTEDDYLKDMQSGLVKK